MTILGIPLSVALNSLGLILDVIGAVVFARGLVLSDELIDDITTIEWDWGTDAKKMYLSNRRDACLGLAFLVVGFLLQLISQCF